MVAASTQALSKLAQKKTADLAAKFNTQLDSKTTFSGKATMAKENGDCSEEYVKDQAVLELLMTKAAEEMVNSLPLMLQAAQNGRASTAQDALRKNLMTVATQCDSFVRKYDGKVDSCRHPKTNTIIRLPELRRACEDLRNNAQKIGA